MADTVRPTKKQRELLTFIEQFITEHGYSPSYREIMSGLSYTSVATVALHVNNLISRGHLRKRDHSARSLEVVKSGTGNSQSSDAASGEHQQPAEEKWLVDKVEQAFTFAETAEQLTREQLDKLYVLTGALSILELEEVAARYSVRLEALKTRI